MLEDGYRRPKHNSLRLAGDGGQHNFGRGHRKVRAMVLANTEGVDA